MYNTINVCPVQREAPAKPGEHRRISFSYTSIFRSSQRRQLGGLWSCKPTGAAHPVALTLHQPLKCHYLTFKFCSLLICLLEVIHIPPVSRIIGCLLCLFKQGLTVCKVHEEQLGLTSLTTVRKARTLSSSGVVLTGNAPNTLRTAVTLQRVSPCVYF